MANIDTEYLELLITRLKGYKKPSDAQRLIIALNEKIKRTDDNNELSIPLKKKLSILLKAEKKADELVKARAATSRIMNAEKTEARKLETRKKVIWGAALKTASTNSPEIAQIMSKLFNEGFVSEADKNVVRADFEALTANNRI